MVATRVYAYHGGTSEDDGLKSRPRAWETSHAAEQIARHIKRSGGWIRGLPDRDAVPQVHFGAIAAGEVVLNSQVSGHAQWIRQNYNDAFAIEMEGAGVAQAGHLNGALPVVVIRGISDRADGTKEITDRARWQERAVANAAAFAMALAEEIAAEDEGGRWPTAQVTARGSNMQPDKGTYRNIARDNARVGIQAGVIQGDIKLTLDQSQPMDLRGARGLPRPARTRAHRRPPGRGHLCGGEGGTRHRRQSPSGDHAAEQAAADAGPQEAPRPDRRCRRARHGPGEHHLPCAGSAMTQIPP